GLRAQVLQIRIHPDHDLPGILRLEIALLHSLADGALSRPVAAHEFFIDHGDELRRRCVGIGERAAGNDMRADRVEVAAGYAPQAGARPLARRRRLPAFRRDSALDVLATEREVRGRAYGDCARLCGQALDDLAVEAAYAVAVRIGRFGRDHVEREDAISVEASVYALQL